MELAKNAFNDASSELRNLQMELADKENNVEKHLEDFKQQAIRELADGSEIQFDNFLTSRFYNRKKDGLVFNGQTLIKARSVAIIARGPKAGDGKSKASGIRGRWLFKDRRVDSPVVSLSQVLFE